MHHEHVFILTTDQLGDVHVSSERVALVGKFSDSKKGAGHLDKLFTSLEKPRWCKGPYTKPSHEAASFLPCRASGIGWTLSRCLPWAGGWLLVEV